MNIGDLTVAIDGDAAEAVPGELTVKRPESVKVGTVVYRVTSDPAEFARKQLEQLEAGQLGLTDNTEATIYLSEGMSADVMRQTLWHEVMHALAFAVMGAPKWRALGKSDDDREESVIRRWDHPTLAVLRDNPDLVLYLTHG